MNIYIQTGSGHTFRIILLERSMCPERNTKLEHKTTIKILPKKPTMSNGTKL